MAGTNPCYDGGSDGVMAEDRESADTVTEGTDVAEEPEFEFESTVSTVVASEIARDAPLPVDPGSHRIAPRPALHRLAAFDENDGSDDYKTPDEDAISAGGLSNPQDGTDSEEDIQREQDEIDLEEVVQGEVGQGDVEMGGDSGGDGDANSDSDGTSQSWEAAWNDVPSSNQNNWSVPLPPFPNDPGPPLPLTDPHVIRVVFRYEMLVEMRFNPGLRAGPPQTRIIARHMSHVSTNF